jgi:hypothetical protein
MAARKDEWYAEFEQTGEPKVRENFGLGRYSGDKQVIAREWLRQKDHARALEAEARNEASSLEHSRIARSAKNAAWTAAIAAIIAAIVAIVSIWISLSS